MSHPAVFLDRDGVIIQNRSDYVRSWSDVDFIPGSLDAMRRLAESPFAVVLVTNQSVVGRGITTMATAQTIHEQVVATVVAQGGRVDGSYLCPHRPEDGCSCRKPAPGMLLEAARDRDLDLPNSYLIGDALSDMEAARAAGVRAILVLTGRGADAARRAGDGRGLEYRVTANLSEAVNLILTPGSTT